MKLITLVLFLVSQLPLAAQEINFGDIYGSLYAPEIPAQPLIAPLVEDAAPRFLFSITPVIQDSRSSFTAGGVLGARFNGRRPVTVSASYLRIAPDGSGADLDRFGLTANATVATGKDWGVALIGDVSTIDDVADAGRILFAGEKALGWGVSGAVNAGWAAVRPSSGAETDDFVGGVGLAYKIKDLPLAIGADYSFENDVDGRSRWSVSLMHQLERMLPDSRLKLAAQRNDTYVASLWIPLKRRP